MLIGLAIRDLVLMERLDLTFGPGLTVLTGETGAGKSIILGALGLATGARGDATQVRAGASQASASAVFAPSPEHSVWAVLEEKGLAFERGEDLVLRRLIGADGRSRAFVNDQATGVGVLRELGEMLVEVHGQHETVGLLDARTHRGLLDAFGNLNAEIAGCAGAWRAWRAAEDRASALAADQARGEAEREEMVARLAELDRLAPREGEEALLTETRATLQAAERALTEIAAARDALQPDSVTSRLGQAFRALGRARERALSAGLAAEASAPRRIETAAQAVDRALIEAAEAAAAIDAAAEAFTFEPGRLEEAEARLFALRAAAKQLGADVDALPAARTEIARGLAAVETAGEILAEAHEQTRLTRADYFAAAAALTTARASSGVRLAGAVAAELAPLKLAKARFRVAVEPAPESRIGPAGADRVEFEIATIERAPFAPLASIASGGELARLALALKAVLASEGGGTPAMIFDEVDQGVGGAVADAVGQRLARLALRGQVLVVTHSPQVAARAAAHWRVERSGDRACVVALSSTAREEEIARMLSGEKVTDAARAAARALMAA